jgi:hypothetical protein
MRELLNLKMSKHHFKMFGKDVRASFKYWYYHWKAFNLVAYYLKCWKFKYLFHDWEKPWLKLFLPYKTVQKIHRYNNDHHLEYKRGFSKIDVVELVIDNECSRFTKKSASLNAREFLEVLIEKQKINKEFSNKYYNTLVKLGL